MSSPRRARLHVVAVSHLDTQWRWTIRDTIERHLPATLRENFRRFDEFPNYVVAFDGSFRYRLIEELDPEGFASLRQWIRRERWTVGGAFVDAADVNLPHPESLVRHALLAVRYFQDRFSIRPRDIFLPDCFGFGFALPTIAAHCGLHGFSSQKLSRGRSAGPLPFELGVWEGIDGSTVLAALDPGGYGEMLRADLSHDHAALYERERSGVGVALRYFGVGDTGGAPGAETLAWLERSRAGDGPVDVKVGSSGRIFDELSEEEVAALPRYRGELLMRLHGPGCYTAKASMKRWNRLNERRARSAEIAACGAAALGLSSYPHRKLNQAWERFLWHQFHDDLTGTSVPAAYDYSLADERLSYADFSDVLAVSLRAIGSALSTSVSGVPLVVWNATTRERADLVEAEVTLAHEAVTPLVAVNAEGQATYCQVLARQGRRVRIAFPARLRGLSAEVFEILVGLPDRDPAEVETTSRRLARPGVSLALDECGRLASLRTEFLGECLSSPVELELLANRSTRFPAWEIRHQDLSQAPLECVEGKPRLTVTAQGPWLQRVRVERQLGGSTFLDEIELTQGFPGVRVRSRIDWRTEGRVLKLAVRPRVEAPIATYGLGWGAIERAVSSAELYEVPAQQWADLSSGDGSRGLAILEDSKHGWDRPEEGTLRMTWIHAPRVGRRFRFQGRQDHGVHHLRWALVPHADDWRAADVPSLSERFENPPLAWVEAVHSGTLGRRHAIARIEGDGIALGALKVAEDGPEIVARLRETCGRASEARLTFP